MTRGNSQGAVAVVVVVSLVVGMWAQADEPQQAEQLAEYTLGESSRSEDGFVCYPIDSEYEEAGADVRILLPENYSKRGKFKRFLFVLPVSKKEDYHHGNGLDEIRKLDLHNKHNLIVIAPSFAKTPWYTNKQESHFIKAVVPAVDELFPCRNPQRLLIGFSKSGWGTLNMVSRYPKLFKGAVCFDAPLGWKHSKKIEECEDPIESLREDKRYNLMDQFRVRSEELVANGNFIWMSHAGFGSAKKYHKLFTELGIRHIYAGKIKAKHNWGTGWKSAGVDWMVEKMEKETTRWIGGLKKRKEGRSNAGYFFFFRLRPSGMGMTWPWRSTQARVVCPLASNADSPLRRSS